MLEVGCLVTVLMLFTLFLIRIVETSMYVQLLILRLDLEYTKAALRRRIVGVALPDILPTMVVLVALLSYFYKNSQ